MSILPGTMIGQYRVHSLLGEGGMGSVYRAEHMVLGRPAAIKVLHPHVAREAVLVQRFINEARVAANMRHRNIVDVLDCGTFASPHAPDGQWFIALEYLHGKSLNTFIAEHAGSPIDIGAIVHVIGEAANGLHAAHEKHHLVHRDVKPDNLFLIQAEDDPMRVKVLDFGIAKLREHANGVQTRSQTVMGTPAYAAPEQLRDSKEVDARADVWALGVITHEMITGVRPWGATTSVWDIIAKQSALKKAPDPREFRPETPDKIAAVISRAMEPDPDRRWKTAKAFACALAEAGTRPYSVNCMAILDRYAPELSRSSDKSVTVGRSVPEPPRAAPPEIVTGRERPAASSISDGADSAYPASSAPHIQASGPLSTFAASAGQSNAPVRRGRRRGLLLALGAAGLAAIGIVAAIVITKDPATKSANVSTPIVRDAGTTADETAPRMSALAVVTSPEGAQVFVNGTDKGKAPINVELAIGSEVEVRAQTAGFAPKSETVTIGPAATTIRIELAALVDATAVAKPEATAPDAGSSIKEQTVKEPSRKTRDRKRNHDGSASQNGSSSPPNFSPNDVL